MVSFINGSGAEGRYTPSPEGHRHLLQKPSTSLSKKTGSVQKPETHLYNRMGKLISDDLPWNQKEAANRSSATASLQTYLHMKICKSVGMGPDFGTGRFWFLFPCWSRLWFHADKQALMESRNPSAIIWWPSSSLVHLPSCVEMETTQSETSSINSYDLHPNTS